MATDESPQSRRRLGQAISITIVACAVISGLLVLRQVTANPRTDDAEILANYIGIAPLVNGPITRLQVGDNQFVKQGDELFEVDDRPYAYALARARSDHQALQGAIHDEQRIIAGKVSGVDVARSSALSYEASLGAQ